MKRAVLAILFMLAACFLMGSQARNTEILDVPTANTLMKGELRGDFKFYPGGGILSRIYVGIFDRLMIGGAERVDNIIGHGNISLNIPWFLGKVRLTDDDGAIPAISIGYEGEGYYKAPAKGVFVAITKEIALGPIFAQLTGTVYNNNQFRQFGQDIDVGAGIEFAITKEFVIGAEFDGVFGAGDHRNANAVIGYFFDPIEIDVGMNFGLWNNELYFSRILKIVYVAYF